MQRPLFLLYAFALSLPVLFGSGCPQRNYRQDMRDFVIEISDYAKHQHPGFAIVPQNGEALMTCNGTTKGTPQENYLKAIDGQGREDLFYGYNNDDEATPSEETASMLSMMEFGMTHNVRPLIIDYCSTHANIDDSYRKNGALGFLSFAAERRDVDLLPTYPTTPPNENTNPVTSLAAAQNLLYLLNPGGYDSREAYLSALEKTNYDVFVIDAYYDDAALSKEEVERLHTKANGGRRLLLAYLSIGEAENYRPYWHAGWRPGFPAWLSKENPNWEGNFKVKYWQEGWKRIIFGSPEASLDKILEAGFDGAYLDIIDAYEYFEGS